MSIGVFVAFNTENDMMRVKVVRNSWLANPKFEIAGYIEEDDWMSLKIQGNEYLRDWIDRQLMGTAVTVVLIGSDTYDAPWVRYAIKESYIRGNAMVGIHLHNIVDNNGGGCDRGQNPLELYTVGGSNGTKSTLADIYPTYDWVQDNGQSMLESWVNNASQSVSQG